MLTSRSACVLICEERRCINMAETMWKLINLKQTSSKGTDPFASIGQGRVTLNSLACNLLENIYDFKYAEVHSWGDSDRPEKIGLRFCKTKIFLLLLLQESNAAILKNQEKFYNYSI